MSRSLLQIMLHAYEPYLSILDMLHKKMVEKGLKCIKLNLKRIEYYLRIIPWEYECIIVKGLASGKNPFNFFSLHFLYYYVLGEINEINTIYI